MNLQANSAGPYDACPYCLTEITADNPLSFINKELEESDEEANESKAEQVEVPEKPLACCHHLGYLSERSPKEQIPDECLTCKDIVVCMLKKMTA